MKNITLYLIFILLLTSTSLAFLTPSGGTLNYITNYTSSAQEGTEIISAGGHIHVMNIEATQQNPFWKGYVGNITGRFSLSDGVNSLFNWEIDEIRGKLYASRYNEITWNNLTCATPQEIEDEDESLNLDSTKTYSINRTFSNFLHDPFYAFFQLFTLNSCPSAFLNTHGNEASEEFQEIILSDSESRIIYTSIINHNTTGFNNQSYDYQLILPENHNLEILTSYFFYIELE